MRHSCAWVRHTSAFHFAGTSPLHSWSILRSTTEDHDLAHRYLQTAAGRTSHRTIQLLTYGDTSPHFLTASNHKVFTMLLLARVWASFGAHSHTNSWEHDVGPSIHALWQRHWPKHNKSRQFRTHLDQSRNCLYPLSRVCGYALLNFFGQQGNGSWQRLEILERDVSSGKSARAIAKDRGWSSSSVRQRVAAIKRGDPAPRNLGGVERRLTPELLDEMREFIEEEHGRVSVRTAAIRETLSRTCSRKAPFSALAFIGDLHSAPPAGPSLPWSSQLPRKISSSWRVNLDVICFIGEKYSKLTRLLQVTVFTHFQWKKGTTYTLRLPFSECTMRNRRVASQRRPNFWATFHDTSHGHSLPRCCRTHVVEPLQEEGRLDQGRRWPVPGPGRCWPRVPSVLHPAWDQDERCAQATHAALVLRSVGEDVLRCWRWLPTGRAPSHTDRATCALLGVMFRETVAWPALSPDLSPKRRRFLWVYGSLHDATRSAIIKTHAEITGDRSSAWYGTSRVAFASALLPTAANEHQPWVSCLLSLSFPWSKAARRSSRSRKSQRSTPRVRAHASVSRSSRERKRRRCSRALVKFPQRLSGQERRGGAQAASCGQPRALPTWW